MINEAAPIGRAFAPVRERFGAFGALPSAKVPRLGARRSPSLQPSLAPPFAAAQLLRRLSGQTRSLPSAPSGYNADGFRMSRGVSPESIEEENGTGSLRLSFQPASHDRR